MAKGIFGREYDNIRKAGICQARFRRDASECDLLRRQLAANFDRGMHGRRWIEQIVLAYWGEKASIRDIKSNCLRSAKGMEFAQAGILRIGRRSCTGDEQSAWLRAGGSPEAQAVIDANSTNYKLGLRSATSKLPYYVSEYGGKGTFE